MTVLVVEDEPLLILVLEESLTAEGYDVATAFNADEAITLLESRADITLVFTDIEMPGSMDGLKLAAAIRDRWPPVKIIITSGRKMPAVAEMPKNSGFIPKPYKFGDVLHLRTSR